MYKVGGDGGGMLFSSLLPPSSAMPPHYAPAHQQVGGGAGPQAMRAADRRVVGSVVDHHYGEEDPAPPLRDPNSGRRVSRTIESNVASTGIPFTLPAHMSAKAPVLQIESLDPKRLSTARMRINERIQRMRDHGAYGMTLEQMNCNISGDLLKEFVTGNPFMKKHRRMAVILWLDCLECLMPSSTRQEIAPVMWHEDIVLEYAQKSLFYMVSEIGSHCCGCVVMLTVAISAARPHSRLERRSVLDGQHLSMLRKPFDLLHRTLRPRQRRQPQGYTAVRLYGSAQTAPKADRGVYVFPRPN